MQLLPVYFLPEAWLPWFVLGKQRCEPIDGVPESHIWPAMRVVSMGWRSAANLFQHLHAQPARSPASQVPAVDLPSWLGRATPAAGLDELGRIVHFVQVYLDNWDKGRLTTALDAARSSGRLGPLQQALRDTFKAWGVARSEKKAVVEQSSAVTLGADFLGECGRSKPTTVKACKLCCWTWRAWADDPVEERMLSAVLGQACFFAQFRRPVFSVLLHAWHAADEETHVRDDGLSLTSSSAFYASCLSCRSTSGRLRHPWSTAATPVNREPAFAWLAL